MLNRIAQAAVEELRGYGITDLTANEIVRLHLLGERQIKAGIQDDVVLCSIPCECGNTVFWPLTCAAEDWLQKALDWFRPTSNLGWWTLPFAMAHSRTSGVFSALISAQRSADAVRRWSNTITATKREINDAVDQVMGRVEDVDRTDARAHAIAWIEWVAPRDAHLAETLTVIANELFSKDVAGVESTHAFVPEYDRWKTRCVELAALAGGSPDEWYGRDRRLITHAYAIASEALKIKAHAIGDTQVPAKLKEAIKALRAEIVAIRQSREAVHEQNS